MHLIRADEALSGTGLFVRAAFHPRRDDRTPFPAGTFVLIGNAGPGDGPPFHPFQRWAMRAETAHSSPLGILIHPEYGL